MKTIAITGRTGVGKSRLLSLLHSPQTTAVVDPLATPPCAWVVPDPKSCGAVVIDHAFQLDNAKEVVAEIRAWCEQHGVSLWIAELSMLDLYSIGIELPEDTFEINLLYPNEEPDMERSDKRVSVTRKDGIALAKQFIAVR